MSISFSIPLLNHEFSEISLNNWFCQKLKVKFNIADCLFVKKFESGEMKRLETEVEIMRRKRGERIYGVRQLVGIAFLTATSIYFFKEATNPNTAHLFQSLEDIYLSYVQNWFDFSKVFNTIKTIVDKYAHVPYSAFRK